MKDEFSIQLLTWYSWLFIGLFIIRNSLELFRALRFKLGVPANGRVTLSMLFIIYITANTIALADICTGKTSILPVFLAGVVLYTIAFILREFCIWQLGDSYANNLLPMGSRLVTTGWFGVIRHPIYFFYWLETAAFYLCTLNKWIIACIGLYLLVIDIRIRIEESHLIKKHEGDYIEYMKKTKRFIPYIY